MLHDFMHALNISFFVLVVAAAFYFQVTTLKRERRKPENDGGSRFLDAIWTSLPTLLVLVIFGWGTTLN